MDMGAVMNMLGGGQAEALAARFGISPEQVREVMAKVGGQAEAGVTDTQTAAAGAAAETGVDPGIVEQLLAQVTGGGGAAGLLAMLDQNKDGSVVDDVMGLAGRLFGGTPKA